MKPIQIAHTPLLRIAAAALAVFLAACSPHTLQIYVGQAATQTADASEEPTTTAAPVEPTPTATLARPPAPAGDEWLLVKSAQGIWMGRPDGSQGGIRIPGPIDVPVPLPDALPPAGDLFAYISFEYGQGSFANPVLNIAPLTGRDSTVSILLTSPETARTDDLPNSIHDALTGNSPFAWSPDGTRLAFIGAREGPSADLYEYYRESGEVVRLTDGPDQAYRPLWSPGGEWIVHGAASTFGSGAGFGVNGFYAARADGGGVISLYDIGERTGDEVGAGWLDEHTLVAHSWRATCGPNDLRLVDLAAQKADLVFDGCLSAVAVGPGVVLFAQSPDTAAFDENPRPGLYMLTASDRTPHLIGGDTIRGIAWEQGIGAFLIHTADDRLLEVSPAGGFRTLSAAAFRLPDVSPDGRHWAYISEEMVNGTDGIFVGDYGMEPRQIFEGGIAWRGMIFSPAGDSLYFLTDAGELHRAQAPDWAPVLLATGLTPAYGWTDMAWWEGG